MDIFYAIAQPTRRGIIEMLAKKGRLSATDISDEFTVSAAAVSQHLKVLRQANVVRVERQGRQRVYWLDTSAMNDMETWARQMTSLWNKRLDTLDALLKVEKKKILTNKNKKHGK